MLASIKKSALEVCSKARGPSVRTHTSIVLLFRSQPLSLSPSELLFLNKLCNIHF